MGNADGFRQTFRRLIFGTSPAELFFKGKRRPYEDAKRLGVIDTHIRELVDAMNIPGQCVTVGSCEGHRHWFRQSSPFVTFHCDVKVAARIAAYVYEDSLNMPSSTLYYYWRVDAGFDYDPGFEHRPLYRLHSPSIATRSQRLRRVRLDADLKKLRELIARLFDTNDNPILPIQKSPDQLKGAGRISEIQKENKECQKHCSFEAPYKASFAEGITRKASLMTACLCFGTKRPIAVYASYLFCHWRHHLGSCCAEILARWANEAGRIDWSQPSGEAK